MTHIVKHYEIPLYRGNLVVVISNDIDKIKALFPADLFNDENIYAHTLYGNCRGQQDFYIVLNPYSKYRKMYHGTIAHEALHATSFLLDKRGIQIDVNNDEPQAYLIEWVTDKVYETLRINNLLNLIK